MHSGHGGAGVRPGTGNRAPWLWWGEVRPGGTAPPYGTARGAAPAGGGFTSRARREQWYAARRTLGTGLAGLGLVPGTPEPWHRVGLGGPGAVRLVTVDGRPVRPAVQFSLAHTARHVLAAARAADGPPVGLGVDAEDDWAAADRNLHRFGSESELALLAADRADVRPLHLWCAKEALAKATGRGFRVPPLRYRLHAADGTPNTLLLEIDGKEPVTASRLARVRVGTRRVSPPTAWAVAELPLTGTAQEGSEHL